VTDGLAPSTLVRPGPHRPSVGTRLATILVDWSLALPLIVLAGVMLVAPVVAMVVESFTTSDGAFTLDNWTQTYAALSAQRAIGNSLSLAATVATVALVVGAPLSWIVSRLTRLSRSLHLGILNVATNFSGIGLGFAYVATLGAFGMVTLAMKRAGIEASPPPQASFWGLVLAYEYSNVPLFVLLSLPAMSLLRDEWWEAAQTSAATRLQFWRHIGWPVLRPFLLADWLLIFTWSVGMYGVPVALEGDRPGAFRLVTVEMYRSLFGSLFGERRMPVYAVSLMGLAVVSLLAYRLITRTGNRWLT
jgi:putative spermidine/putrescine transport system permease protein